MTESAIKKDWGAWSRNTAVARQPREQCLETTSIRFHHESVCAYKVMPCFHFLLAGTQDSQRIEIVSLIWLAVGTRSIHVAR